MGKYKGVFYDNQHKKYRAVMQIKGKKTYLGCNTSEYKCHLLYQANLWRYSEHTHHELRHKIFELLQEKRMLHKEKVNLPRVIDKYYAEVLHHNLAITLRVCTNGGSYTVSIHDYDLGKTVLKYNLEEIYDYLKK